MILFWRDIVEDGRINLFSVCVEGLPSAAKHRVVVTYVGEDAGFGSWRCSRDGINHCAHVMKCQVYFGQLLAANHQATPGHDVSMVITGDVLVLGLDNA